MKEKLFQSNFLIILFLFLLVAISGANLYFTINPPATPVIQGLTEQQQKTLEENKVLLEKVKKLTEIPKDEQAIVATITDADGLRSANPIQAEVYKDAKTGNKVIGFAEKMIIYDEQNNKIVYEGKSPQQIQQEQYLAELAPIMAEVSKLTNIDPNAKPTLATVTDPAKLQASQPELYKDAQIGDKLLAFGDRIIIYRPSTNKIIFDGKINVNQGQAQPLNPSPTPSLPQ